jgi:Flp pilus assembly protein TadB
MVRDPLPSANYRGGVRRRERVQPVTGVPPSLSDQLRRRRRWYFLIMGTCLVLILLAWTWVRLWSTPLAVAMSMVAAVLPPIAAFVGSGGVRGG